MKKLFLFLLINALVVANAASQDFTHTKVQLFPPDKFPPGDPNEFIWIVRPVDYAESFTRFDNPYPGDIMNSVELREWENEMWHKYVPLQIMDILRETAGKFKNGYTFDIHIFVDKEGKVFEVQYVISDKIYPQLLEKNPEAGIRILRDISDGLKKEECEYVRLAKSRIYKPKFDPLPAVYSRFYGGYGDEFVVIWLTGEYFMRKERSNADHSAASDENDREKD